MHKRIPNYAPSKPLILFLTICFAMAIVYSGTAGATMDGTPETPQPTFTRDGDIIVASLIPRAKSTTVLIAFSASEGRLAEVKGMEFKSAARPEVDEKDFKSELFVVSVTDVPKGAEIRVDVSSDFFSKSTEFWGFNSSRVPPWTNMNADNQIQAGRIRTLRIAAQDGGPSDTDGAADGRITLIGGPKDSFWGYALGTLFIRFFGIFLVLSVLMIGMMLSGRIFKRLLTQKKPNAQPVAGKSLLPERASQTVMQQANQNHLDPSVAPETAAAIAAALHMHLTALQTNVPLTLRISERNPWTQQGRDRLMSVRYFNRRQN